MIATQNENQISKLGVQEILDFEHFQKFAKLL